MVGITAPFKSHLTTKDRTEFDHWTGDDIQRASGSQLQKAFAYFKGEGYLETAAAISARMSELGCSPIADVAANGNSVDTKEARCSILSFQEEVKQRQQPGNQDSSLFNGVEALQPPVRSSKESVIGSGSAAGVKRSSKDQGTAAARQSADLLNITDQQLGADSLKLPASGTAAKPAAAAAGAQQRSGQPMVQEVEARGSQRTQQLLEQNMKLPETDRHAAAEVARCRGNDFFRCGAYADAIEEYTVAIGLHPEQVAYYTNRAAAYLKLKHWEYAEVDATSALDISAATGGAPDSSLIAKALLRRAEAFMGMSKHQQALQDYEQVNALLPDEIRAQQGAEKARAKLGISRTQPQQQKHQHQFQQYIRQDVQPQGMHRIAVQECDSDDDEQQDQQQKQQQGNGVPAQADREASTTSTASVVANGINGLPSRTQPLEVTINGVTERTPDVQEPMDGQRPLGDAIASASARSPATASATEDSREPEPDITVTGAPTATFAHIENNDTAAQLESDSGNISSSESESSVDSSDSRSESESENEADAPSTLPTHEQQLDELRMAGNNAYKAGKYRDAIALYQKALLHCPDAATIYLNRCMTHLQMQQYKQAHTDASMAVALDPKNHKAYHKRHQAKQRLQDYQGALKDLQQCIELAPPPLQPGLTQELKALQATADRAHAVAQAQAAAAHAAGFTDHGTVQIQEEVEDPAEASQRLHDELVAAEASYGRLAAKVRTKAEQLRTAWQLRRERDIQQLQAAAAARRAARQQAKEEARVARRQARAAAKQQRAEERQARAVAANARPTGLVPALTPTSTPADADAASMQQHPPPAPSAVLDSITAQVLGLKDQGNMLMAAGDFAGAETAYIEALQLDGDNVKVLLNLAALRLKQHDGAGALRCCDEVLAQQQHQQLAQQQLMKAQLRRGLALELLDDPAAALAELANVCEQLAAAGLSVDAQLAADMSRVSAKVQHQRQQPEVAVADVVKDMPSGSSASTHARDKDQQQLQQGDAITGMRASIPVVIESSSESDAEEEILPLQQQHPQVQYEGADSSIPASPDALDSVPQQQEREQALQQGVPSQSTTQEQQQGEPAAVLDDAATSSSSASPGGPSRRRIAVIEESSSDNDVETETESIAAEVCVNQQEDQSILQQEAQQAEAIEAGDKSALKEGADGELDVAPAAANQLQDKQQPDVPDSGMRRSHSSGDVSSQTSATAASAGVALQNMDMLLTTPITLSSPEYGKCGASSAPVPPTEQQQQQRLTSRSGITSSSSSPQKQQQVDKLKQEQEWQEERYAELKAAEDQLKTLAVMSAVGKGLEGIQKALRQLQTTAEQERENGNAAFAKGQLQQALKHYNAALASAPTDARSYANRAQVYLKLKRWQHVETDCNTVLLLLRKAAAAAAAGSAADDQLRQKCMYRRALAWKEQGKLREAIADLKQLMGENPRDTAVQRLMNDLKQAYAKHLQQVVAQQQQQQQQKNEVPDSQEGPEQEGQQEVTHQECEQASAEPSLQSSSVSAAEHKQVEAEVVEAVSQVYRHRILIEETDGSESDEEQQQLLLRAAPQEEIAHPQERKVANGTSNTATTPLDSGSHTANSTTAAATAAAQKAVQHLTRQQQLTAPRTALEFTRVAKMLLAPTVSAKPPAVSADGGDLAQNQHLQLGAYVRLLEPSKYQSIMKRELSDSALELLLRGLEVAAGDDPGFVVQALQQLSQVERFAIVLPMAVRKKGVHTSLQNIMQQLSAAGKSVDDLRRLYMVC